jgi:hypothetical protein
MVADSNNGYKYGVKIRTVVKGIMIGVELVLCGYIIVNICLKIASVTTLR